MSASFEVSKVEPGTLRLDTIPVREAIHRLASLARVELSQREGFITVYPPMRGYEASSYTRGGVFSDGMHPLVAAVQLAFDAHLPLSLSPDHVWIVLAQGFANHLRLNSETLRERFVAHEGQLLLSVRRDDFVRGAANPWPELFDEFTAKIRQHLGKRCDLVVANFSTTGPLERTVSQLVLLDAMQGYFEYELLSLCGIPRITLTGTPEDWRSIRARAEVFVEYGLEWWVHELRPILDKFVAAAEGEIDTAHWCSMYKLDNNSGGPYITGWLSLLFPYLRHRPAHDAPPQLVPNQHLRGWRERMLDKNSFGGAPTTDAFPAALACVPMRWKYLDQIIPMQLLAGFAGVRQDPTTLEVTPQLGWAVRDTPQP
jgi:hypothetical protein